MTERRDGRIVTFYSYKGGTGRTMALANTAWILAANGKRVLAVDWDLEAPGLHRFFHPFLDPSTLGATTGVIDLITEYAWAATSPVERSDDWHRDYARIQPHAVSLTPENLGWGVPGRAARSTSSPPGSRTASTPRRSPPSTGTTSTTGSAAATSSTRCATT